MKRRLKSKNTEKGLRWECQEECKEELQNESEGEDGK